MERIKVKIINKSHHPMPEYATTTRLVLTIIADQKRKLIWVANTGALSGLKILLYM